MPLNLSQKQDIVAALHDVATSATSAIVADYRGLTVDEMTELRAKARQSNVFIKIVRNTLARRAFEGTEYECLTEALTGPNVLLLSADDPGAGARILRDFIQSHENLEVRAISLGGSVMGADSLKSVADLPSYEQAIGMLMSVMQAPMTNMARCLSETYGQFVRVTDQVRQQKEQAA